MDSARHPLKPDETIHKILISSTSRMFGEFISDDIIISHAWQNFTNRLSSIRTEENPASRSGFIIAFRTEPHKKELGVVVPDYSHIGEIVCSYLSVLFGKRFDCHGMVEGSGSYKTPDLSAYNSICNYRLPFNSHQERNCFKVPLNLSAFSALSKLLTDDGMDLDFTAKLNAACKFYMQALQSIERDSEVAYLHLITSGEILASFFSYKNEDILDQQTLEALTAIRQQLDDGERISKQISGKLLGVKRRFVKALCSLVDQGFYDFRDSTLAHGNFKPELLEKSIGAAYDLRSKYVHTGVPFGGWIQPSGHNTELQIGRPVVNDRDFAKILEKAPTFIGLERFIRYCILSFMASKALPDINNYKNKS